ncbi:hypothetical protein FZC66_16240 [Priestia megaterium]|nr:hypothetical protein FZC66_16240 [Priestia megaterium]
MIQQGKYGVYKGAAYKMISQKNPVTLRSDNPADQEKGFQFVKTLTSTAYIKKVALDELDDAYEIILSAKYQNHHFGLASINEQEQTALLVTNNPALQKEIPLNAEGKSEFTIQVSLQDVQIIEEKKSILGFSAE